MIGFAAFFGEVNRGTGGEPLAPHAWQARLADRLAAGQPPHSIVVPTGGGKTATIDALVWALAQQVGLHPRERTIGVRTIWAIDRRILVDEVHARASRLADRLERALVDPDDPVHSVATALSAYTGAFGPPLTATRWRGQVRIEPRAHHPLQPEIITSTVAQVGSRLLFRGFGVGERSLAIEAALSGVDCTICLDEAHLAEPFRQTVDAVRTARASSEPRGSFGPLTMITLSATPSAMVPTEFVHTTDDADEPTLARRLDATKVLNLTDPESDRDDDQAAALLEAVGEHIDAHGARRVACVVNSVRLAVLVADRVNRSRGDIACVLLIGPQRPHDRQRILAEHRVAIFERHAPVTPLLVVATQTIEVGLDADFEALVTQSASATAIVQRLGRLNRAGMDAGRATVVRQRESLLYLLDEERCWAWLESRRNANGEIDASPRALASGGEPPPDIRMPLAPALTPETIDLLQQTAPRPAAMSDPAIEPFLRGVDDQSGDDVLVCWRADLRLEWDDQSACRYREALLRLAPPRPEELVTIGLRRLHMLLQARFGGARRTAALAIHEADVEGAVDPMAGERRIDVGSASPRFVVVRDGAVLEIGLPQGEHRPRDVRPGDVVVLAAQTGGYAHGALAPDSSEWVDDVGNAVALKADRNRPVGLRLARELLRSGRSAADLRQALRLAARQADQVDSASTASETTAMLAAVVDVAGWSTSAAVRRVTGSSVEADLDVWDDLQEDDIGPDDHALLEGERSASSDGEAFVLVLAAETRPDLVRTSAAAPPTLEGHAKAVAHRSSMFAQQLGGELSEAIVTAARAHDHGKADDRIQAFFRGGTAGVGDDLIAKSVFGTDDRRAARLAQQRSGLPRSLRHEIASVAMLEEHLERSRPNDAWSFDTELALHLVGTHHGLGRPWPPVPVGGIGAQEFAVSIAGVSGAARGDGDDGWACGAWATRFFSVTGRYGAWGTAYLEAMLVLADRTVSAEGG